MLLQTTLPKVPAQNEDVGAVLFVDISGFTNLGNKLRKDFTAAAATEYLVSSTCVVAVSTFNITSTVERNFHGSQGTD